MTERPVLDAAQPLIAIGLTLVGIGWAIWKQKREDARTDGVNELVERKVEELKSNKEAA